MLPGDLYHQLFLVRSPPELVHAVEVGDRWFAAALIAVCAVRLARTSWPGRQRLLPVHRPAIGFAAAVAARSVALQWISVEDPFNAALFTIFAVGSAAVDLLAIGLISGVVRARAERRAVARIGARLGAAPAPGSCSARWRRRCRSGGCGSPTGSPAGSATSIPAARWSPNPPQPPAARGPA